MLYLTQIAHTAESFGVDHLASVLITVQLTAAGLTHGVHGIVVVFNHPLTRKLVRRVRGSSTSADHREAA